MRLEIREYAQRVVELDILNMFIGGILGIYRERDCVHVGMKITCSSPIGVLFVNFPYILKACYGLNWVLQKDMSKA